MAEIVSLSVLGQVSIASLISGLVALVQGFYRFSEIRDMRRELPHGVDEVDTLLRLLAGMKDTARYAEDIAGMEPENFRILSYVDSVIISVEKKLRKVHKSRFWWLCNVPASTGYLAELRHRLERAMDTYVAITCRMELRNGHRENRIRFNQLKERLESHWKQRNEVAYDRLLLDRQPSAPPHPEMPNPEILRLAASAPADDNRLSSTDASMEEKYDLSPSRGLMELERLQRHINEALDNGLGAFEIANIIGRSEHQTTTPSMAAQQLHAEGLSLYQACASGTLSAVKQMLQLQPKCTLQWLEQNEYPLHVAAEHNHHLVVKEMLQYFIATCTGDELELLLRACPEGDEDNTAWTALHEAAFKADAHTTVDVFLDLTGDALSPARFHAFLDDHSNPRHYSPLHW